MNSDQKCASKKKGLATPNFYWVSYFLKIHLCNDEKETTFFFSYNARLGLAVIIFGGSMISNIIGGDALLFIDEVEA